MLLNYFLLVLGVLLFFQGFFPMSTPHLEINNDPPSYLNNVSLNKQAYFKTNITKAILVVIDALRLDFVTPYKMPLTTNLVQKIGCFNKVKVEMPTVTLPRIKALTVGNIPQFIDVVLNLINTEISKDSLIHSASRKHKKIVFYGDDTWLKLFPDKFFRAEGTNSFFVRDFKEVDDNVTRNVHLELQNNDWDIMILHYLGLDHIGHVYGPFSSLIPAKLEEMDKIIFDIYNKMASKRENILLMITGDHGMKDSGGHGGSTFPETHVPLVVIGHECENTYFSQTDIPVNLAVLLGLQIPSLAIGKVQKKLLNLHQEKYLYALHYNSILLKQKNYCCNVLYNNAATYHTEFLNSLNSSSGFKAEESYERFLNIISNNLAMGSVRQNLNSLIISFLVMLNLLIILLSDILFDTKNNKKMISKLTMLTMICVQFYTESNLKLILVMSIILSLILFANVGPLMSFTCRRAPMFCHFFVFVLILHPVTFISSSYVEEEHQFWYFVYAIFLFLLFAYFCKTKNSSDIFICLIHFGTFRFLKRINSTGDKWATYPDISDWLLKDKNIFWYQMLFILGLMLIFFTLYLLTDKKMPKMYFMYLMILFLIFIFKQNESSTILGKIIWLFILIQFILTYSSSASLAIPWVFILTLLLKPYNIILIPYCILSSLYMSKQFVTTEIIVFYHTLLSSILFFAQGHSNSLASVDISVGYIGLSEYQPILVICQVLCHTQAFPVLCHLLMLKNRCIERNKMWKILFCNRLYVFFVTCIITFIFRHHLFIWSVFAPKLFVEFTHTLFLFMEYLIIEGNELINYIFKSVMGKEQSLRNIFS